MIITREDVILEIGFYAYVNFYGEEGFHQLSKKEQKEIIYNEGVYIRHLYSAREVYVNSEDSAVDNLRLALEKINGHKKG